MPKIACKIELADNSIGFTWTRWPPCPVLSIYGQHGQCLHRSRSSQFDLTDSLDTYTGNAFGKAVFGMRSTSTVRRRWTADEVHRQEQNIRYDLSEDGFRVALKCIKGIGLECSEEIIWSLNVTMA